MSYETLNAKVLELKDDMIASIQQNMRIESVRGESAPGAPYGEGPKAALDDVLALLDKKPEKLHVLLTGRDARPELIERADLVTEMKLVKHPYQQGIKAQQGIEF